MTPSAAFRLAECVVVAVISVVLCGWSSAGQLSESFDAAALFTGYEKDGRLPALTFHDVRQFVSMLDRDGSRWIAQGPRGHRERVIDDLAAEVAASPGMSEHDGFEVIEWACGRLRKQPSDEFALQWMHVTNEMFPRHDLESTGTATSEASSHLSHALREFPDDPRLRLLRLLESRPETRVLTSRPGAPPATLVRIPGYFRLDEGLVSLAARQLDETITQLRSLTADPVAGPEAQAHVALLEFHLGRLPDALQDFTEAAGRSTDAFVQNLAWLGASLVLDAQERTDDAAAALTQAVAASPSTRASAVALATHLALIGQIPRAVEILSTAYDTDVDGLDPWRHIVSPERTLSADLESLRRMAGVPARPTISQPSSRLLRPDLVNRSATMEKPTATQSLPTFRVSTNAVTLNVSVTSSHVPVTGLSDGDFEVLDNGVPQIATVRAVADEPLDLSLVVSFFVKVSAQNYRQDFAAGTAPLTTVPWGLLRQTVQDVSAATRLLHPDDRVRVIQVDGDGAELWPLHRADTPIPPDKLPHEQSPATRMTTGWTTYGRFDGLYDAAAAALFRSPDPGRRHVVLVFTDGVDAASVVRPDVFQKAAGHTDAVMYVIMREDFSQMAGAIGVSAPNSRFAFLPWEPDPDVIRSAAKQTGGDLYFSPHGFVADDFARILDRFRQSYVLTYQATGVPASGQHSVSVRVTRPGRYEVKSRSGYEGG